MEELPPRRRRRRPPEQRESGSRRPQPRRTSAERPRRRSSAEGEQLENRLPKRRRTAEREKLRPRPRRQRRHRRPPELEDLFDNYIRHVAIFFGGMMALISLLSMTPLGVGALNPISVIFLLIGCAYCGWGVNSLWQDS